MIQNIKSTEPDHTAIRVALWRALHLQIESAPHVFEDAIGLKLAAPAEGWQARPDMHPQGTMGYRASIVGRARFVEDLLAEKISQGLDQYVILGAGLDTFAQRRADLASKIKIFEIDQPGTSAWKRQRLVELGYGIPEYLKLVPVDFEAGDSWPEKIKTNGFDSTKPALISSTGVAMYLTKEANLTTLKQIANFAPGSTLVMTFMLPAELVDAAEREQYLFVQERARMAGTPFVSFFSPEEALALGREAGFKHVRHVSRAQIIEQYFAGRKDGFKPASGEEFLIATT